MNKRQKYKVFLSHSSKDSEVAKALIKLLEDGTDKKGFVFCTSEKGSVPGGSQFIKYIRRQLSGDSERKNRSEMLVLFLLTPAFYRSRFCLCEAGAAWVLKQEVFPLLLDMDYDRSTPTFAPCQQKKIAVLEDLEELRKKILNLSNWPDPFEVEVDERKKTARKKKWEDKAKEFQREAEAHAKAMRKPNLSLYFTNRTNAIVEHHINKCAQYIKKFFEKREGEIWLFDTDLGAFTEKKTFESLYKKIILPHRNIRIVRMLLRGSFVDRLLEPKNATLSTIGENLGWNGYTYNNDKIMLKHGDKLQFRLMNKFTRRSKQYNILNWHQDGHGVFDYDEGGTCKRRRSQLGCYTLNESFIFYVHGKSTFNSGADVKELARNGIAACVHRKLKDGTSTDLRVTITAKKSVAVRESMGRFISEEQLKEFAILFAESDWDIKHEQPLNKKTAWRPFSCLLKDLGRKRGMSAAKRKVKKFDWRSVDTPDSCDVRR